MAWEWLCRYYSLLRAQWKELGSNLIWAYDWKPWYSICTISMCCPIIFISLSVEAELMESRTGLEIEVWRASNVGRSSGRRGGRHWSENVRVIQYRSRQPERVWNGKRLINFMKKRNWQIISILEMEMGGQKVCIKRMIYWNLKFQVNRIRW